jgi:hydrogenase maturation protease
MTATALVAGIGNIFQSDDGFGVEVANRLAAEDFPSEVRVADFGIRGVHLAYELLDGYECLILIDAVDMRDAPGTLAVIEPEPLAETGAISCETGPVVDAHSMSPDVVLGTLAGLGGSVGQIFVVGCQPQSLDEGMGLSNPVTAAVDGAVQLCRQLVADVLRPVRKEARA